MAEPENGSSPLAEALGGGAGLTWMADAGVPVHVPRRIAGHGSLVTTSATCIRMPNPSWRLGGR